MSKAIETARFSKGPTLTDEEILNAGLQIHGEWIHGWWTQVSQMCDGATYNVGETYTAPWFSVCRRTPCHPGLYLAGKEWVQCRYPNKRLVKVRCKRSELVHAGNKWRAKMLQVIESD